MNDEVSDMLSNHQKWTEKANCYQTSVVILLLKVILQEHQNQSEKILSHSPRKLKAAVPPVPKPRSTLNRPTAASQLNNITSRCSNESTMPASRPKKITPCCSNESLDGDLPAESIGFKRSESTVKQEH